MPDMMIRTKIVATVGPASESVDVLRAMALAGVDVFRVNCSHGDQAQHGQFLRNIRAVEAELGRPVAVMADLCGPKIRVGRMAGGQAMLETDSQVIVQRDPIEGTAERISTTLPELPGEVKVGEVVLVNDGKIRLEVTHVRPPDQFVCRVTTGGLLAGGKGVNLPGTALSLSALTDKDRRDAAWIAERDFDYVAMSFVRTAGDVQELRGLLEGAGCDARIVAKIEKPEAMDNIEAIVAAADAVMVARGDLGVEMALPAVPVAQKRVARLCQAAGKCCIIATQMLESMTHCPTPTRAEVSDVANAVLDYADAVMLSGETAVGEFPVQAVSTMNEVVSQIQAFHDETHEPMRVTFVPARTAAAMAAAVNQIVDSEDISAVAVFTITGTTARMFAKQRLACPILALSPEPAAVRRMCLYYGVVPVATGTYDHTRQVLEAASTVAKDKGLARPGDRIVIVSGRPLGSTGNTNTLVIHTVA